MVPNSAKAMPTLPRMKYFHAASSASWVSTKIVSASSYSS
jgi:hypothetical protein